MNKFQVKLSKNFVGPFVAVLVEFERFLLAFVGIYSKKVSLIVLDVCDCVNSVSLVMVFCYNCLGLVRHTTVLNTERKLYHHLNVVTER